MFCNSLQVGWSFNINAGYMFGFFLMALGQVLVCYNHNQDQTQCSAALMLQVVWVKIAKAEPQFSDLIYELQHHHGPGHARTASTSCPAQWRQFLEEDPPDLSALLRTDLHPVRQLWQLGPPVSCHPSCSGTEGPDLTGWREVGQIASILTLDSIS